jgi:HD-GYP domain-containing protein (c-di-GMP phosphodiesterase class II)
MVADAWDAMTDDSPVRDYQNEERNRPLTPDEAMADLWAKAGAQFDPEIVGVFSRIAHLVPLASKEVKRREPMALEAKVAALLASGAACLS